MPCYIKRHHCAVGLLVALLCIGSAACKKSTTMRSADLGLKAIGSSDGGTAAIVRVAATPRHLATGVSTAAKVRVRVFTANVASAEAVKRAKAAVTVRERATNLTVLGSWVGRGDDARGTRLTFTPASPFHKDTEYVIDIDPSLVKSQRRSQRFRVGSLPRVAAVSFVGAPPDTLQVRFSERVDTQSFAGLMKLSADGNALPLSLLNPGVFDVVALRSATALASKVHTLTIESGTKGPAFDSEYSGKAGNRAFTIAINPRAPGARKEWSPDDKE